MKLTLFDGLLVRYVKYVDYCSQVLSHKYQLAGISRSEQARPILGPLGISGVFFQIIQENYIISGYLEPRGGKCFLGQV